MGIDYSRLAIPKPRPRFLEKAEKVAADKKAERECYAQVDRRDSNCCRVCRKRVGGIGMLEARHRHHLIPRSLSKAEKWETRNVVTLCPRCHHAEHSAEIRLSGDADQRSQIGVLNGVKLERAAESGWKVEGWR